MSKEKVNGHVADFNNKWYGRIGKTYKRKLRVVKRLFVISKLFKPKTI